MPMKAHLKLNVFACGSGNRKRYHEAAKEMEGREYDVFQLGRLVMLDYFFSFESFLSALFYASQG